MLATFDEVDLERELISRSTGNQRLRLRTPRLPMPLRSWLASWLTIGGWKSVIDLVRGATIERRMWSMLVVPVNEQFELILESCLAHRDQPAACSLAFHRPDEPFEDRDAAALPNSAKPWLDCLSIAPGLVAIAPELRSLVTDEVLRRCARDSDGSVEKRLDVFRGREIAENGKTHDATRVVIEHDGLFWTSDFDVHGRTVNSARNRKFETGRLIVDGIR